MMKTIHMLNLNALKGLYLNPYVYTMFSETANLESESANLESTQCSLKFAGKQFIEFFKKYSPGHCLLQKFTRLHINCYKTEAVYRIITNFSSKTLHVTKIYHTSHNLLQN